MKTFEYTCQTDIGKVRHQNEDYFGCFSTINGDIFVVCDGIGGHAGGDVASKLAVESFRQFFEKEYYENPFSAILKAFNFANSVIYDVSYEKPELKDMGTTCVLAMFRVDKVFYAHAGDSRIYYNSNCKLHRLTKDHSYVQGLVDKKLITEEEAENHPAKNIITKSLGHFPTVQPSISEIPLFPDNDDILMLCTDGLTGLVKDTEIESILNSSKTLQQKAVLLIAHANENGGYDNSTIQLIRFKEIETNT
ncbi:MAG: Stp1/IreP family PP2C-type Ser/Thr phosphatase [Bacteroidota bacterium]|nr:Stp1/IreP family PP2C-type Ser/Thr phosphatase [Bacteroidota bacterium]